MRKKPVGVSLIETLLALGIMAMVLTVIVSSFMIVMIRSAKVRVLKNIEEDGKYALRVIEQKLRSAKGVTTNGDGQDCESEMAFVKVEGVTGEKIEFGCLYEGTKDGRIVYLEGDDFIVDNDLLASRLTTPSVKVDSCSFSCTPGGFEAPDRIDISFRLSQAEVASRVEEQAVMDFQTTVVLRNF